MCTIVNNVSSFYHRRISFTTIISNHRHRISLHPKRAITTFVPKYHPRSCYHSRSIIELTPVNTPGCQIPVVPFVCSWPSPSMSTNLNLSRPRLMALTSDSSPRLFVRLFTLQGTDKKTKEKSPQGRLDQGVSIGIPLLTPNVTESALNTTTNQKFVCRELVFSCTTAVIIDSAGEASHRTLPYKGKILIKTSQSEREGVLTANGRSRTKEGIRLMRRRSRLPTRRYYVILWYTWTRARSP